MHETSTPDLVVESIPSTIELLSAMKPIRPVNSFDRFGGWIFRAVGVLTLPLFGALIPFAFGTVNVLWLWPLVFLLMSLIATLLSAWMIGQLVEAAFAWRAGFKPFADSIDARVRRERQLMDRLVRCDATALHEHARHLELEAKLTTRRVAAGAAGVGVAIASLKFLEASQTAAAWPRLQYIPILLCAAAVGLSIGTVTLAVLAGRLERVAGLLALAADRLKNGST